MCNHKRKKQKRPKKKASTRKERETPEYVEWREKIFRRDKYQCQRCRKKNTYIQAHHIRPWSLFPKDRFKLKNGVTLCRRCHWKVHHSKASKFLDLGFGRNKPVPKPRRLAKSRRSSKRGKRFKNSRRS